LGRRQIRLGKPVARLIDLAFGIEVDEDFDAGKVAREAGFDRFHDCVRLGDGHRRIDPDVELGELVGAAGARSKVVDAA
jgi:hypothetical protein